MSKGWRGLAQLLGFSFRVAPYRSVVVVVLAAVDMGAYALFALWLKFLADGAAVGSPRSATVGAIGMMATVAVNETANWVRYPLQETLRDQTSLRMDLHLMELSGNVPTLEHYERSDYVREIDRVRAQRRRLASAVGMLATNVGLIVRMAVTAALLASLSPILLVLPLFAVPAVLIAARVEKWREATREAVAESERSARMILWLCSEPSPAKELRVFGLAPELTNRYQGLRERAASSYDRTNRRATAALASGWIIFSIGYLGAIALVVMRALRGQATAGDVLLAMSLAAQVTRQVSGVADTVGQLQGFLEMAKRYVWLVDYAARTSPRIEHPVPVPQRLHDGIRFEGVSFNYPGTHRAVLTDIDLFLPAGATVAFVGDNGAGKTTLVKLLLRLYDPTQGSITVDDVRLSQIEAPDWLRDTSAAFQDFMNFELLARETVGVGDVPHIGDAAAVLRALERAGARDVLDALPQGLESQLGRQFDDGTDLSTGQWQKVAIGRGMMREFPLLLVLDEPTASLDPMTESALFERYADVSKRLGELRGSITILVSHRFSTVRMADLIIVIEAGKVVERGSHEELIAKDGLYAELYQTQARAYR